jgi:hypothetical protein
MGMTKEEIVEWEKDLRQSCAAHWRQNACSIGSMIASALRQNPHAVSPKAAAFLARAAAHEAICAFDMADGKMPV